MTASIIQRLGHIAVSQLEYNRLFLIDLGLQQRGHLCFLRTRPHTQTLGREYTRMHISAHRPCEVQRRCHASQNAHAI